MNRQYEFDLQVTDKENNPLQDATITVIDKDGAQVFSAATDENGAIAIQNITRGYYQYSTGNTLQDLSPHTLNISKMGYQSYVKTFVLFEKTKWAVKLAKAQPVLLDCGQLVVNLKPADSENNLALPL